MSRTGRIWRIDILILVVAASAVAIRVDRELSEAYNPGWVEGVASRWQPTIRSLVGPTLRLGGDFLAALSVLTLGLGFAALRGPFVPSGRRWPGRGRAAIAASGLTLAFGLTRAAIEAIADPTSTYLGLANPRFLSTMLANCEGYPPDAVLGAWSLLILSGRWRSTPIDGLERLGRWLGWGWLASLALDLFQSALW